MFEGRLRAARIFLLAAGLAGGAVTSAWGEPICAPDRTRPGDTADSQIGFTPTFESDATVPMAGVFRLTLKPSTEVRFHVGSMRAYGDDDGYGGVVMFPVLAAGRYHVRLSQPATVELLQNYRHLPLLVQPGEIGSGDVDLKDGALVLQIRAAAVNEIVISISTPPPCRRGG